MQTIASRLWSETSWWHPGGLAWQFATEQHPGSIRTWGDHAWAWMYQPDVLMLQVSPEHADAAPEIIAWFDDTNTGTAPRVEVADGNDAVIDALRDAGYAPLADEPFGLDMRITVAGATDPTLPAGYVLRTGRDVASEILVAAHRAAWVPADLPYAAGYEPNVAPGATSSFSLDKHARARADKYYAPERDLVIVTNDGEPAACCNVWLDPVTGAAEIEPLGVSKDHRRRGLAQALCHAAVAAVAGAGGSQVVIHPRGDDAYPAPRAAYAAAGFRQVNRTRTYGKSV